MNRPDLSMFQLWEQVLLRCWLIGAGILLVWVGVIATGVVRTIHGPLMGLSPHELDVIHYCGMGLFKLLVIVAFFLPWLSLRLVVRSQQATTGK